MRFKPFWHEPVSGIQVPWERIRNVKSGDDQSFRESRPHKPVADLELRETG